jgi:hypothetical protein
MPGVGEIHLIRERLAVAMFRYGSASKSAMRTVKQPASGSSVAKPALQGFTGSLAHLVGPFAKRIAQE